ncbi:MAG TPA: hypothetical protein VGI45_09435 [Terracidiphilus sp.]
MRENTAARPCNHGGGVAPSKRATLFLNIARWFDLSSPGRYFVQVAPEGHFFDDTRQTQKSNVLEVDITNVQEAPNNDSLAVWIEMQKEQVPMGQEPWAIVTMKNMSHRPVTIHRYRVHVEGKDGEPPTTRIQREMSDTLRPGEMPLPVTVNAGPETVEPDASCVRKFQLRYLYNLSAPGKYTIYAEVMDPSSDRWVRTKPVTFEMVEKPHP